MKIGEMEAVANDAPAVISSSAATAFTNDPGHICSRLFLRFSFNFL